MGGWLSLLVARARPERLAGLVLIAAAPDFTERMLLKGLSPEDRATLRARGPAGAAVAIFARALGLHLEADRGGTQPPACSTRSSRCPARCACCTARAIPTCRGNIRCRSPQHLEAPEVITTFDQGRRSPAQHAGRHRPPDRDGRGAGCAPHPRSGASRWQARRSGPSDARREWRAGPRDRSDSAGTTPSSCLMRSFRTRRFSA